MKIDLTYQLTKEKIENYSQKFSDRDKGLVATGHLGTHFDVMGKNFPLDYTERNGIIFDVRKIDDEIKISDVEIEKIQAGDFVIFYTGVSEKFEYGSDDYNTFFPQLSFELIEKLAEKKISIIGVDMRGIRKGDEHPKADNFCAQNGVFVVENLVNLDKLFDSCKEKNFTVHTYPMNIKNFSGLPSRVIAEF